MKYIIAAATIASGFTFAAPAMAAEGSSCHFHGNKPTTDTVVVGCANQRNNDKTDHQFGGNAKLGQMHGQ